jgi:hypothetical protein
MLRERTARWSKWRLAGTWWVVQSGLVLVAMVAMMVYLSLRFRSPLSVEVSQSLRDVARAVEEREFWTWWLGVSVGLSVVQAVILWPVRRPAARWGGPGRSMWVTLVVCSLLIAGVWSGAVLSLMDVVWLAGGYDWSRDNPDAWMWLLGPLLIGWAAATPLVVRFTKGGRREDRLGRIASRLFLGTVIEVVAIVPLDVMVRRKTDCYCGRGTFWAFLACGTAGLAALGPAVLLPLIARRRKRWYAGDCDACGYDMSGTMGAERCPECGAGWREGA